MQLLKFIKENNNWEYILSQNPYCLKIKRDDGYIILSYNQIESDFYNPIVRECRGIILEEKTLIPVCVPFYKFGNYGEGYVPNIDWSSARTQEKVDGSLIKVWYHNGKWRVSTNGTIDAINALWGWLTLHNLIAIIILLGSCLILQNKMLNLILIDLIRIKLICLNLFRHIIK